MKCIKMKEEDYAKGWCWKYCLACMLEIDPDTVPSFAHNTKYLIKTRNWLKKRFKKGIVFVPVNQFLETSSVKQNTPMGPAGYSIMIIDTIDPEDSHAVIAKDGKLFWDCSENNHNEFTYVLGYYVIYDLQ